MKRTYEVIESWITQRSQWPAPRQQCQHTVNPGCSSPYVAESCVMRATYLVIPHTHTRIHIVHWTRGCLFVLADDRYSAYYGHLPQWKLNNNEHTRTNEHNKLDWLATRKFSGKGIRKINKQPCYANRSSITMSRCGNDSNTLLEWLQKKPFNIIRWFLLSIA